MHEQTGWVVQGGVTKLKEYMRGLNILPHKRKRKLPPDGMPRSPCTKLRSPRSPDGTLPGHSYNPLHCARTPHDCRSQACFLRAPCWVTVTLQAFTSDDEDPF